MEPIVIVVLWRWLMATSTVSRSFFSVELCFSFTNAPALHSKLQAIIQRSGDKLHAQEKWRNHRDVADLLLAHIDTAERGCWEYMDDDSDDAMWDDWLLPMNDASRQPQGTEAGGHFTITMMMQCRKGTSTDATAARAFRTVGDQLWTRGTFAAMLQTIPGISFGGVVRDALYLMPRDNTAGFTDDELATARMQYLRPLG
jgi:hypothetical protein